MALTTSIKTLPQATGAGTAASSALARLETPAEEGALDESEVDSWQSSLAEATAEDILHWALDRWPRRVALCTAFQAEGSVLLDMAWRIDRNLRVITLDTGRLPQETHNLIERVRWRYGIKVEVHTPSNRAVEAMVSAQGPNLFFHSLEGRRTCCEVRKVEPLRRALAGFDAWITGLRRDQAPSRAGIRRIELDTVHGGITKLNPLADWTHEQVWAAIEERDLPYHPLYDQGYTSIGCAPCTRPAEEGEDSRAGRWWWEVGTAKECGLHFGSQGANPLATDGADRPARENRP
ncbi:MAG: phosphoadenylyl-sulfate reductase [Acidobacteriota bacterium]